MLSMCTKVCEKLYIAIINIARSIVYEPGAALMKEYLYVPPLHVTSTLGVVPSADTCQH